MTMQSNNCLLSSWRRFQVFESPYLSFHPSVFFGAPLALLWASRLCRRCESLLHFYVFVSSDPPFVDCATHLIMDFSKAFDSVPHQRLLMKLRYYGICGILNTWPTHWLTCRSQSVVVDAGLSLMGTTPRKCQFYQGSPRGHFSVPSCFSYRLTT